ncbi:MAG: ROK family protein [Acidobacteria bacterium]|nr:ROK family protein [Acidobacteriota bacterium]
MASGTSMGASSEVVRDMNRRLVLNLVRTRQPLSRADLARLSGLQRSTISLIVDQLIGERWIVEGPTGRLPRGRRPTFLRLNEDRRIIGVDIRPTQITIAVADVHGKFTSQQVFPTPPQPKPALEEIVDHLRDIMQSGRNGTIEGIGITLPGRYDETRSRLVFAPNLKWTECDLRGPVESATGLPVSLENAANACVLAAVWFGHRDPVRNLVTLTVSEGIGAGVLVNGEVARGSNGMAGEFGHVPLAQDGPRCGCGSRGCWEVFASNKAALRYYAESKPHEERLLFPDLLRLADQGDTRAIKAIEKMAHFLGRGMRMIIAGLAPERIDVIGDLTQAWHRYSPIVEEEVQAQVLSGGRAPRIVPIHEDGLARLRGTVPMVLAKDFGDATDWHPPTVKSVESSAAD